jgi:predicted nucleotidyltransferase component of viral defense system
MTTKARGNSVRQKLIDLSKELSVQYENLETAFMIERLVVRLVADKNLSKHLVFKGGFVGLRVYNSERYTVDLDALLVNADIESTLRLTQENAESDLDDGVWFRFEGQVNLATQGEYGGVRQIYRAGIGEVLKNIKKAQVVHFDLGVGDAVTPGPQKMKTTAFLSKNEDISWSVYPLETIVAEKIHALVSHGNINSRSKDVHDLSVFLQKVDAAMLCEALKKCFAFRETDLPSSFSKTLKNINTTSLERGWLSATLTVPEERKFKAVFDFVVQQIAVLEKSFS